MNKLAVLERRSGRFWPWVGAVAGWLAVMIATPLAADRFGPAVFPSMAALGVLAHTTASLLGVSLVKSGRWILSHAAAIAGLTFLIELIGITTGLPFGAYHYTSALQPQLLGVPLLIPCAWFMMLVPAWGVTEQIIGLRQRPLVFAAVAGLVFTAWDLYLDPLMVGQGLWVWEIPGGYFGIPWINFFGWWLSSSLVTLLLRPRGLPRHALLIIYSLAWGFNAVGLGIYWQQPGPALAGLAGMGVFVVLGWLKASGDFTQTGV